MSQDELNNCASGSSTSDSSFEMISFEDSSPATSSESSPRPTIDNNLTQVDNPLSEIIESSEKNEIPEPQENDDIIDLINNVLEEVSIRESYENRAAGSPEDWTRATSSSEIWRRTTIGDDLTQADNPLSEIIKSSKKKARSKRSKKMARDEAPKLFPCTHPGCQRSFGTHKGMKTHRTMIHREIKQDLVEQEDQEEQISEEGDFADPKGRPLSINLRMRTPKRFTTPYDLRSLNPARRSSVRAKRVEIESRNVSDARYTYEPTNYEPDEVESFSEEHLKSLEFKYFNFDPADSLDDILSKNPILDCILGTKKFTPHFATTSIDDETPPGDKVERNLAKLAGDKLNNHSLFDYYCKTTVFERIMGTKKTQATTTTSSSSAQPSTSTEKKDSSMEE